MLQTLTDKTIKMPVVRTRIFGWHDNEYRSYANWLVTLSIYIHKNIL